MTGVPLTGTEVAKVYVLAAHTDLTFMVKVVTSLELARAELRRVLAHYLNTKPGEVLFRKDQIARMARRASEDYVNPWRDHFYWIEETPLHGELARQSKGAASQGP